MATPEHSKNSDRLFPHSDELKPFPPTSTFGQCPFREGTFSNQPTETQLTIAKEIVRQANRIDYFPTTATEADFSGDCLITASGLAKYGRDLGINGSFELASVRKNPFDGEWRQSTRHIVVIHNDGHAIRTIDPTTMVGYGHGTVSHEAQLINANKLTPVHAGDSLIYEDITLLSETDITAIRAINSARHDFYVNGTYSTERGKALIGKVEQLVDTHYDAHMHSWLSELHYIHAMALLHSDDKDGFEGHIRRAVDLDPLKPKAIEIPEIPGDVRDKIKRVFDQYKMTARSQVDTWLRQARENFRNKDSKQYRQGLELIQWAFRELKGAQLITDQIPTITIDNTPIPIYNINPRLLADHSLTVAWIKPSAELMGRREEAAKALKSAGEIVWQQDINLSHRSPEIQCAVPLIFTHPHGIFDNNLGAYWGDTRIFLIKARPATLTSIKRDFRNRMQPALDHDQMARMPDGSQIHWDPGTMNYLHTCNTAAESVVHLLPNRPDLCLVNRWDYPHPNL